VVALAGVDAHGQLALRSADPGDTRYALPFPGYNAVLGTLSVHVRPDRPLTGEAAADAARIVDALRMGRAYTALDGLASPPAFEFTATHQAGTAQAGDAIVADGPLTLHVRSNAPQAFMTMIWQGLQVFATEQSSDFSVEAPAIPGVYRVEIRAVDRPRSPIWISSNPIYVRAPAETRPAPDSPPAIEDRVLFDGRSMNGWRAETDRTSVAALEYAAGAPSGQMRFRFGLSSGSDAPPFAAVTMSLERGLEPFDRLTFRARAEQPMRVSIQVRAAVTPSEDDRWHRSVYIDPEEREQTVYFDDFTPIGDTRSPRPPLATVHSLAFVVDTANTRPGSSGRLWIGEVRLQR
jgi:hypothetical protein